MSGSPVVISPPGVAINCNSFRVFLLGKWGSNKCLFQPCFLYPHVILYLYHFDGFMQSGKIIAHLRYNPDIKLSNAPQRTHLEGDYSWKDRDNGHDDMHRFCILLVFVLKFLIKSLIVYPI